MKIRNAPVPEGINVSKHSPLIEFFWLGGTLALGAGLIGLVLIFVAGSLARFTPVGWEVALADAVFAEVKADAGPPPSPAEAAALDELQALADRLSPHMDLPEGLPVTLHFLDDPTVNAFATLGGHVFVFRGLVERLESENALAMVMAHEIAHVARRDPAAALSGALALQLALAVVLGTASESVHGLIIGPNALMLRAFGREAERQSDRAALAAVARLYGHVGGAGDLFALLQAEAAKQGADAPPAILSTHPLSQDRTCIVRPSQDIGRIAAEQGWAAQGPLTPMPEVLRPDALAKLPATPAP